jgi:hypothetical protein
LKTFGEQPLGNSYQTLIFDKSESSEHQTWKLRLLFLLVKGLLQSGAVKSQEMKNGEALEKVSQGKEYLKLFVYNLLELVESYSQKVQHLEREVHLGHEDDKAYFSPFLQFPELKKFKHFHSNSSLVHDFQKFTKEIFNNDPTEQAGGSNSNAAASAVLGAGDNHRHIIYWKHNTKNNEKYFMKELAQRSRDLGVTQKLTTMWIKEFNIGNIMHINPVSYGKLSAKMDFFEFFSVKTVVEVVLTYCCCLFSIATEHRFICAKELELDDKSTGHNDNPQDKQREGKQEVSNPLEFQNPHRRSVNKKIRLQKMPAFIQR